MGKKTRMNKAPSLPKQIYTHVIKFNQREEANIHRLAADVADVLGQNLTVDQLIRKCIGIGFEIHLQAIHEAQEERRKKLTQQEGASADAQDTDGAGEGESEQESTDSGEVAESQTASSDAPAADKTDTTGPSDNQAAGGLG